MTIATKAKEILLATAKWQTLASDWSTLSDSVSSTEITLDELPVCLVRTNRKTSSAGANAFLPNGEFSYTLFLEDPATGDIDARSDAVATDAQTILAQIEALAGTAQYLIIRSMDASEPMYCDDATETDAGEKYWQIEITGEWGMEF